MDSTKELNTFLEDLRAPTGAPGGGAASALAGSMGAALFQMVSGVTLTLPRFTEGLNRLEEIRTSASTLCDDLKALAQKDTDAYRAVESAMKMPKSTADEKKARRLEMQNSFKNATLTPLETVKKCLECLAMLPDLIQYGNPNAVTDIAVGAILLKSGLQGACMNAEINLSSIKDAEFVESAIQRLEQSRKTVVALQSVFDLMIKNSGLTL